MTEEEWLACTEPSVMLDLLVEGASDRKLRLFACACCRRIWHLLTDERSRRIVEITEANLDEPCNDEPRNTAVRLKAPNESHSAAAELNVRLTNSIHLPEIRQIRSAAMAATAAANVRNEGSVWSIQHISTPAEIAARTAASAAADAVKLSSRAAGYAGRPSAKKERAGQSLAIRDIFGNPFRPVTFDPSWRTLNVVRIAQILYDERNFEKMPELADALERTGLREEAVLAHCREPSEHVRGCWVVDMVLGKE